MVEEQKENTSEKMYAIIDIETTGGSPEKDKITEIAIIIHNGNRIVEHFSTLINPERSIPQFISKLTGISNEMVCQAPTFAQVAKRIVEITANKIFIAHNVSFDYNFIRNEFKQLGYEFKRKQICTVKLAQELIPGLKSYSLGNICSEMKIIINDRHRAEGDAIATTQLFEKLLFIKQQQGSLPFEQENNDFRNLHPSLKKKK